MVMMLRLVLVLGYMVLSWLSATRGYPQLAVVALLLLLLIFLLGPLRDRRPWAWAIALASVFASFTRYAPALAPVAIFLPPVVINVALAWLFGHTLQSGDVPLVTRLVRIMHSNDEIPDPAVWPYARRVTGCWTALFMFNALACLGLAVVGSPNGLLDLYGVPHRLALPIAWWSFHSDVGCYLLMGILFFVEYSYRRRRFPWQPYRTFLEFLRHAIAAGPVMLAQLALDRRAGRPGR